MRLYWISVLTFVGWSVATPALAQPPLGGFSASRFTPAPGPGNYLETEGAQVHDHLSPSVGLMVDYAHEPLVIFGATCTDFEADECDVQNVEAELVSYLLTFHVYASISLYDRVQLGLVVPLSLQDGDGFAALDDSGADAVPVLLPGGSQFGLSDPRFTAKVRFLGEGYEGIHLGATVFATAPIGQLIADDRYLGDDTPKVGGNFIVQFVKRGIHVAGNVGGFWRKETTLLSTSQGSEFFYRGALGYEITPLLTVIGEVAGSSSFSSDVDENPLEGRLALRLNQGDFSFLIGGGGGIVSGVGIPRFRLIGSVAWAKARGDSDADGIPDGVDGCPSQKEDRDGFEDRDGCPEFDNDGDGIPDEDDRCVDDPEDADGFQDNDGCPDEDNDGDQITDGYDSCPDAAEDFDGDRDEDGCPDNDRDNDGVPDPEDQCPDEPEDTDGYGDQDGCPETDFDQDNIPDEEDECPDQAELLNGIDDSDGCPEPDTDGDGIVDASDRCPEEAETYNGVRDTDGCADGQQLVRTDIESNQILLLQQIQFASGRSQIRGNQSKRILRAVATILKQNPQYTSVRIEGHTDDVGSDSGNLRLSQKRAEAVVKALIRLGVPRSRLQAQGFGPSRPLQTNDTEEGRAANRRVEFHLQTD